MQAQLEVQFGGAKFSAQGTEEWVDSKYDAFIAELRKTSNSVDQEAVIETQSPVSDKSREVGPLAIYLKDKNVGPNQNKRFLATAVWLKRQGHPLKTAAVTKALADAQQQRLGNPADILNQNVKKGFCVKTADGFYVTPEGEESLG